MKETYKHLTVDYAQRIICLLRDGQPRYPIEMSRCVNSAELLDFILQINGKGWVTAEHIKEFLDAVEEVCHETFTRDAQGIFCPDGKDRKVVWP